jgi:hypothetical protein
MKRFKTCPVRYLAIQMKFYFPTKSDVYIVTEVRKHCIRAKIEGTRETESFSKNYPHEVILLTA